MSCSPRLSQVQRRLPPESLLLAYLLGEDEGFVLVGGPGSARIIKLGVPEAEAYRMMAAYNDESTAALALLRKAEEVLQEERQIPPAMLQEELALILRERVYRYAKDSNLSAAQTVLRQLEQMVNDSQDQLIEIATAGAAGAIRLAEGKYEEALSYLQQDDRNPISVKLMVTANQKMGHKDVATQLSEVLANWNEPTLEQSLIVPEFRPKDAAASSPSSFRRM